MIALLGYGVVGQGVVDILRSLGADAPRVVSVVVADPAKPRQIAAPVEPTTEWSVALADDVTMVVDVIGEVDRTRELMLEAMARGKHVVTANKAVVSAHLEELSRAAEEAGVCFRYEAAVAGGVPVIRELLSQRRLGAVDGISGVINGSCNWILDQVFRGMPMAYAMAQAQELGYLEADPSADVDGVDAQRKLRILATLAFGGSVHEADVLTHPITGVTAADVAFCREHGRTIRQISSASCVDGQVTATVLPTAVGATTALGSLGGATNAVTLTTRFAEDITLVGQGAGRYPTASAVVTDILDVLAGAPTHSPLGTASLQCSSGDDRRTWYVRAADEARLTEPLRYAEAAAMAADGCLLAWD